MRDELMNYTNTGTITIDPPVILNLIEEHMIEVYFKSMTGEYIRYTKGEGLTISANPVEEERKFVADANSSNVLRRYSPSIAESLTMYEGDPLFNDWMIRFHKLLIGGNALIDMIVAFNTKQVTDSITAWHMPEALLVFTDMAATDSKLNATTKFGGIIEQGTISKDPVTGKPIFIKDVAEVK